MKRNLTKQENTDAFRNQDVYLWNIHYNNYNTPHQQQPLNALIIIFIATPANTHLFKFGEFGNRNDFFPQKIHGFGDLRHFLVEFSFVGR